MVGNTRAPSGEEDRGWHYPWQGITQDWSAWTGYSALPYGAVTGISTATTHLGPALTPPKGPWGQACPQGDQGCCVLHPLTGCFLLLFPAQILFLPTGLS